MFLSFIQHASCHCSGQYNTTRFACHLPYKFLRWRGWLMNAVKFGHSNHVVKWYWNNWQDRNDLVELINLTNFRRNKQSLRYIKTVSKNKQTKNTQSFCYTEILKELRWLFYKYYWKFLIFFLKKYHLKISLIGRYYINLMNLNNWVAFKLMQYE